MITHAYMPSGVSHPHLLHRQAAICAKSTGTCLEASPTHVLHVYYWGIGRKEKEGGRGAKTKKRWRKWRFE